MELFEACGRLVPAGLRPAARRSLVRYRHVGLRPADALLVSYPASGSTWLRFLLAHALTGVDPDFDSIRRTIPPVGRHRRAPRVLPGGGRLIRSHEPLRHQSVRLGQPVLYLVRDGRTVALSYYDHLRREGRVPEGLAAFLEHFVAGTLDGYGPWPDHVAAALSFGRTSTGPFLLVRYEDLRANPAAVLRRVLRFLGREGDPDGLEAVVAAHTKDRMRAKEASSRVLAARRTDGSPVVRPEGRPGWAELVPADARARFERACRPALEAAGYLQ